MGRPRRKGPTVKARMYKSEYDELRLKFPNQSMSDLISIAYRTSPLRIESKLRISPWPNGKKNKDVKNKR